MVCQYGRLFWYEEEARFSPHANAPEVIKDLNENSQSSWAFIAHFLLELFRNLLSSDF